MRLEEKMNYAAPGSGARHGKEKKLVLKRFGQTVEAALTSDEQYDWPTVPDTVAPPLVFKRRKARLARRGAAGKKTANKAAKKKKRGRYGH